MKLAKCRLEAEGQAARTPQTAKALGSSWIQLGNDILVLEEESSWGDLAGRAGRDNLQLEEYPDSVNPQDLYLVAQKGRLFEQEHPDVRVVLNKGRYLVVQLSPEQAKAWTTPHEPCYGLKPLPLNTVVFDQRAARAAQRKAPEAWIQNLVSTLSRTNLETTLTHLVSYPTRYSTSTHYTDAATWSRGQLESLGYRVSMEPISFSGGQSWNVVAEKLGGGSGSRNLILVVAHLDSINLSGGPDAIAPGADDNGSGSAGLLEMARVLKDHSGLHDLRFILFGGEEQGLHGSRAYVKSLPESDRKRIQGVINMDMIGTLNTPSPAVLIEGAAVSQAVIDRLAEAAATYTSLTVQTSLNPFASDHVPFIEAGLPAVLTIEGADSANSAIHSANDTLDRINYDLALEILRMNVAAVAAALGQTGGTMPDVPDVTHPDIDLPVEPEPLGSRLSGRYKYNGGASPRSVSMIDPERSPNEAAIRDPIYNLNTPVYMAPDWWKAGKKLRFTLHIDIDGPDPLNVVSGTVAKGAYGIGQAPPHFIGRVAANTISGGTRNLVVEDFSFRWPSGGRSTITRLEIALTGTAGVTPTASVTFIDTARNQRYGPYSVPQESVYFRDVEVDIDREDGAADVEPYNTQTHPDRPADLPAENLTLESAFAKAGIRITRSPGSGTVINTSDAGTDNRWNLQELHDSMELHWDAFANKPQWKMWIFLAELADDDGLGGVMFDGDIDEPGGVDRQGTAVFTKSPFFHSPSGGYPQANPPAAEAAQRELFFNLIHETGHAFNLAHSFQKQEVFGPEDSAWTPPSWMPLTTDPQALSWMNYPEQASPGGGLSATWFYQRFRFRFDDNENLYLRHAPDRFVQMGNSAWFQNHGRVSWGSLDRRLEFVIRSRKEIVDLGEPVFIELKLKNISDDVVLVHDHLDPSDGLVELAVTNPKGERCPLIPIAHTRCRIHRQVLQPGQALYHAVNLTVGHFGFPFKEPGTYRIEGSYLNTDGSTAAAVMHLHVRPPAQYDDLFTIRELFDARIGRALYVGGSRMMEDVNDKLDWVIQRLGETHPAQYYLRAARALPWSHAFKVVDAGIRDRTLKVLDPDPDLVQQELAPVVEQTAAAADALGHIEYRQIVDAYTESALEVNQKDKAVHAQKDLLGLFKDRGVVQRVIDRIEQRINELT